MGDSRKDAFVAAIDGVSPEGWQRYKAWSRWLFQTHGIQMYSHRWYEMRWDWAMEDPEWFEEISLALLKGDL